MFRRVPLFSQLLHVLIGQVNYVLLTFNQLSDGVMDLFKLLLLLEQNYSTKFSASCTLDLLPVDLTSS